MDLFSGLIYRMLGISEDLYTPLFAIARVPGWCAHRVEEVEFANRIIRPAYKYVGKPQPYITPGRPPVSKESVAPVGAALLTIQTKTS